MSDDWVERRGGWSTDEAARLYGAHRLWLVRLGVLLVDDLLTAEEVVQDAFAGFLSRSRALRDPDEALAYLRTSVVNRSRSALRRRRTAREYVAAHDVRPGRPADQAILDGEHREILDAVAQVPNRQREVLVLRCWSDLSETQIAETLRITRGTVQSSFHRALEALEKMLPGTVTSGLTEDRLRDALRARAELVAGDDLRHLELPDPAPRSRRTLLLALAAAACAAVVAVPFLTGPPVDDQPDGEQLPEGAVRMDVNGDSGQDLVNVDFDPAARTYLLTVEVLGGPTLTYQGLALTRPTLVGAVDLDADSSAEIAVNVGDDTTTLPEFFRYVDGNIRRLSPPPTAQKVNGWDMTSRLNQFTLQGGRLYTWQDDPRSVQDPQRTGFWQWQVVGEDRIQPGPRQERCLTGDADLPVDCVFLPGTQTQQTRADLDGDGTPDDVRLEFDAAADDVVISGFDVSVDLATGGTVSAEGPAGWRPLLLEPLSIGSDAAEQLLVTQEGGDSEVPTVFGLVDSRLQVAHPERRDQLLATGFDGSGRYTRYWVESGSLFSYRTLERGAATGPARVRVWSWAVAAAGNDLVLRAEDVGEQCVDAAVDELPTPC